MAYRSPKQRWASLQILFKAGGIVRPPPESEFNARLRAKQPKNTGYARLKFAVYIIDFSKNIQLKTS